MNEITIQMICENDLPRMLEIWNPYSNLLTSTNKVHTIDSLRNWFKSRHDTNHEYYGLFVDEILVGFMIIRFEKQITHIKMTALDKKFQGLGYGKKLITFAFHEFNSQEFQTEVKIENIYVINALILNGFKIVEYDKQLNEYILKFTR